MAPSGSKGHYSQSGSPEISRNESRNAPVAGFEGVDEARDCEKPELTCGQERDIGEN
jgi:hypothetical protein